MAARVSRLPSFASLIQAQAFRNEQTRFNWYRTRRGSRCASCGREPVTGPKCHGRGGNAVRCVCVCAWGGETSRWETWLPFPAPCASAEAERVERSCGRPPLRWTSSAERRPFRAAGPAPCVGTRQWRPHQGAAAAGPVLNRASSLADRLLPPRPGPSALLLASFSSSVLCRPPWLLLLCSPLAPARFLGTAAGTEWWPRARLSLGGHCRRDAGKKGGETPSFQFYALIATPSRQGKKRAPSSM